MAHSPTLITAPGETLADALHDLTKIAHATYRAAPFGCGVVVVRRPDLTVVAAYVDPTLDAGQYLDERLPAAYYPNALPDVFDDQPFGKGGDA